MPKFKPKTNKNIEVNENDILTVDRKHEEILKELKDEENKIPKLEEKIEELKKKVETIATETTGHDIQSDIVETCDILECKLNMLDEISALQDEIETIKEKRKDYYLNNSRYLFNYFENKKDISKEMTIGLGSGSGLNTNNNSRSDHENTSSINSSTRKQDSIDRGSKNSLVKSFFKIKDEPRYVSSSSSSSTVSSNTKEDALSSWLSVSHRNQTSKNMKMDENQHGQQPKEYSSHPRSNLPSIDETNPKYYFSNMDESFIDMQDYLEKYDICEYCQGEMSCIESEGIMVCKRCYRQKEYLVEHDKPSYKEPPKEVSFYAYKRINHFREIIAQFQAKETTNIDDQVIIDIKQQIKKERITIHQLSNDKMKQILKKLGYNKYYEHISFIKEKIGIKPPKMSIELETKLCNLFLEIQKPYAKFCPNARVNFLNYYYVLYKLCELLREDTYLPYFYMLKDQVKRMEQDEIWKKICKYLNWEFIPTL